MPRNQFSFEWLCALTIPGHDEEAGAVDDLRVGGSLGADAAARDGDVGAAELPGADVDETVPEDEVRQAPASVVMSAAAALGICSSGTVFAKPSQSRTWPAACATATRPM